MSTQSFADLGVSRAVTAALSERGITKPFAIQNLVVADVLAGRDVLAQSPTGSGKTLAFGVPMVDMIESTDQRPAALVLAPTRELVSQIVDEIRPLAHARALKIASVYGGVGLQKQAREAARAQLIIATPGRLEDLLERGAFSLKRVKLLVLDEADRMLDMGFRPAVDRIVAKCPSKRQTLFFSATLEGEAGKVAHEYTTDAGQALARPVAAQDRLDRAPLRQGRARRPHEGARPLPARRRPRADARVRPHQARRRPARQAARRLRHRSRRHARRQVAGPAREGARPLQVRQGRHARRHRRRRARHRRQRHLARHQLRSARGLRHLRAPHRPYRPARARAASASRSSAASRAPTSRRWPRSLGLAEQFSRSGHTSSDSDPENRGKRRVKPPRGSVRSKQHSSNGKRPPRRQAEAPVRGCQRQPARQPPPASGAQLRLTQSAAMDLAAYAQLIIKVGVDLRPGQELYIDGEADDAPARPRARRGRVRRGRALRRRGLHRPVAPPRVRRGRARGGAELLAAARG